MPDVHIVTDSCAHFTDPQILKSYPITVVPNRLTIGGKIYREGLDLDAEEALGLIARHHGSPGSSEMPVITVPSADEFAAVYARLLRDHDAVISIHASREIFPSWANGRQAAQRFSGSAPIAVIDSKTLCAGQGLLVAVAARAARREPTVDDVVRLARGAAERVYSIYHVENVHFLMHNKVMSDSHAILSAMMGIKPFVTIEEGQLAAIEKVRTRAQTIERLVEFAVEFTDIEEIVLIQPRPTTTEQTRMLQERLTVEFPGTKFPYSTYGATLAALIGPDATGIVILEEEMDDLDDF
jgi:DegV family protein with EDD domain